MRFIHAADIHFAARNPEPALMSLAKIAEVAREREVDLIVIAGDLFDAPIRNSDADSMPKLLDACGVLLDAAPVVSVQGTPSHDAPGCYEPIMRLEGERHYWHHIDARSAGKACGLFANGVSPVSLRPAEARKGQKCIITGLPEPSRGWLSARGDAQGRAETGEAVVDGLRSILAGIGVATQGRTVPHIHVQHGEVRGATLASGQVLPPGGIAVGTEDLALTGADYVALGHIHKGQQLNPDDEYGRIVYSGSAYPVDWGERDEKLLRVVTLGEDGYPDAEHVPYGHPARIKLELEAKDVARGLRASTEGIDAWFAIKVPADYSEHDATELRERVERDHEGFARSVRVTIERAPRERVRVPNISTGGWLEQFSKWATSTSTKTGEEHMRIVLDLQAQAKKEGAIPVPRRWRIKSLRLRGSIGIWRGGGGDEIAIDFDDYDAGLVGLVGSNGSGKTTLLENLTPWPTMLTRSGPLQDHFRLRDSVRELVLIDDATDDEYRCLIQIDSQSGRREQRVYRLVGVFQAHSEHANWEPLGADGSTAEYERVVDELWGPRSLYLLSVVTPQKPITIRMKGEDGQTIPISTDIGQAPKGQRRAVLRQLLGLGAYQAASRSAVERASGHEATYQESLQTAGHYDADADRIDDAVAMAQQKHSETEMARQAGGAAENRLKRSRADLESAAAAAAASREARSKAQAIDDGIKQHILEKDRLNAKIAAHGGQPEDASLHEAIIRNAETDNRRFLELLAAVSDADNAWLGVSGEINDRIRAIEIFDHETRTRYLRAKDRRGVRENDIAKIDATPDSCHECGQKLPDDALEGMQAKRRERCAEADAENAEMDLCARAITAAEREATDLRNSIPERPMVPAELTSLEASAGDRGRALAKARTDLQRASEWATKRQSLEEERARLTERIAAAEQDLLKAEWGISKKAENDHVSTCWQRSSELCKELAEARGAVQTAEAEARHARAELERCQEADRKRTALLGEAETARKAAEQHRLVATALGPDGVQSLLLEASAPAIADAANDLLDTAYGSRWRLRIDLQRASSDGKRQIEDVRLLVRDTTAAAVFGDDLEPGEQPIETLSGGESRSGFGRRWPRRSGRSGRSAPA